MSGLLDLVTRTLGGDASAQIGNQVGAQPAQVQSAIGAALPMLLAGLQRNASSPGGAQALLGALQQHDGGVLDDPRGLSAAADTHGAGILGHLLGGQQDNAQLAIANTSGLNAMQVTTVMTMLAPIVMGALGRMQRTQGLDANGVASMVQGANEAHAVASPDLMGMATQLLGAGSGAGGGVLGELSKGLGGLLGGR